MQRHRESFLVRKYELGADRRMRIQALCNYMEEVAGNHADALGFGIDSLLSQGLTWVLAKMRIHITSLPSAGDFVTMETWPVGVEGAQFQRDYLCYGPAQEICARATTQWVIMDMATRRLKRINESLQTLAGTRLHSAKGSDIRIPALTEAVKGPSFRMRLADIDSNSHVNNVRYLDFALEAAHAFGLPAATLEQFDIVFRAEAVQDDCMDSATQPENCTPKALLHGLYRGGQEIVRARTLWK